MLRMFAARQRAVLLAASAVAGCHVPTVSDVLGGDLSIPAEYPQLSAVDTGKADLVVDGVPYPAEDGTAVFDNDGVDTTRLRLDISFDTILQIDVRDLGVGEYTVTDGALEAAWSESLDAGDFTADTECGGGTVKIVGSQDRDVPYGEQHVLWGTIQLQLCHEGATMEVSGRFSVIAVVV